MIPWGTTCLSKRADIIKYIIVTPPLESISSNFPTPKKKRVPRGGEFNCRFHQSCHKPHSDSLFLPLGFPNARRLMVSAAKRNRVTQPAPTRAGHPCSMLALASWHTPSHAGREKLCISLIVPQHEPLGFCTRPTVSEVRMRHWAHPRKSIPTVSGGLAELNSSTISSFLPLSTLSFVAFSHFDDVALSLVLRFEC